MENEQYKVECFASGGLVYLHDSFEVLFYKEESMIDFMNILPDSYSTKHYKRDDDDNWTLIGNYYPV